MSGDPSPSGKASGVGIDSELVEDEFVTAPAQQLGWRKLVVNKEAP